jgi:hypothetical protein
MVRWLVVEEAFADARGVMLKPRVVVEHPVRGEVRVTLRTPDGRERSVRASVAVAHVRGALAPFGVVWLHGVAAADVPRGAEVWAEEPLSGATTAAKRGGFR